MSIEAMKQALEALEMGLGQVDGDYDTAIQKAIGAVTNLRAAIEAAEKQEPVAWMDKTTGTLLYEEWLNTDPLYTTQPAAPTNDIGAVMPCGAVVTNVQEAYYAGKKAAAQPAVLLTDAQIDAEHDKMFPAPATPGSRAKVRAFVRAIEALLREKNAAQPAPVQEPVGKWMGDCIEWTANPYKFKKGQSIYTTPPAAQRQWVGLAAKDLAEIPPGAYEGAIWADAKLREKNGGRE